MQLILFVTNGIINYGIMKTKSPLYVIVIILLCCHNNLMAQDTDDFLSQFIAVNPSQANNFYLSKYEESVAEYQDYLDAIGRELPNSPPDYGWDDTALPMVIVSYNDIVGYCNWLTDVYQLQFRLPTETEWEMAKGDLPNEIKDIDKPVCIDCMQPNTSGVYGMNGNVWEWTSTKKNNNFYTIKGGSYGEADSLHIDMKYALGPTVEVSDVGFRLAMDSKEYKKYAFASKVRSSLVDILPNEKDIRIEPYGLFIDGIEFYWGENDTKNTISIDEEELSLLICCVDTMQYDEENDTEILEKSAFVLPFSPDKLSAAIQFLDLIENRDSSIFKD